MNQKISQWRKQWMNEQINASGNEGKINESVSQIIH